MTPSSLHHPPVDPTESCPPPSRLDAYFDRELSEAGRAQVESHLSHCPACQQALQQIAATSSLVKSIELPVMSQIGRARVLRELTESAAASDRWLMPIRLLTAVAAAVFLIATGLIVYQFRHAGPAAGPTGIVQPVGTHQMLPGSSHFVPTGATNP